MKRSIIIVALLAIVIVVSNFLPPQRHKPYIDEAKLNLGAIRSLEVAYFAEWNVYVGNQPLIPVSDRTGNAKRHPWHNDTRFSLLGFTPEGDVECSYALEGPDWPQAGYTARVECDRDGDGIVVVYTTDEKSAELVRTVRREPGFVPWLRSVWRRDEKYAQ